MRRRSGRGRHRAARPARSRVWAGTSAVLAAAGIASITLLPHYGTDPARLDAPRSVLGSPVAAAAGAPAPAPATGRQLPASTPVRIQLPALGVTSPVIELGLERDGSMEVPAGAYPVGWYEGSPTPGQLGPAVLAGHVDWEGEPGAFSRLGELRPGDTVVIDRADGTAATFSVERVTQHPKDDFPTEQVYGDIDHAGLRLITCSGAFDEDSGEYLDNVVVHARFTGTG